MRACTAALALALLVHSGCRSTPDELAPKPKSLVTFLSPAGVDMPPLAP